MPDQRVIDSSVTIIALGVSNYENFRSLPGVKNDLKNVKEFFCGSRKLSLYSESQLKNIEDCSLCEAENIITDYVHSRSARGDILIFYFSGHGAVLGNGDFYFCMKDTKRGFQNNGFIPVSALSLREVIQSLSIADVLPCFIIDACFSGASINGENVNVGLNMEYIANKALGNSYAILASSGSESFSYEDAQGGYFTNALNNLMSLGMPNNVNHENMTIRNVTQPLNRILSTNGAPLARLHIGKTFPQLNLCKNKNYKQNIRKESFIHSYKPLFEYIYREGTPKSFKRQELRADFPTVYGNNNKFIYIWGLLEEIQVKGEGRVIQLTNKGKQFYQNKIRIPKTMVYIPDTDEWVPAEGTDFIFYRDL